ncbi:MAG: hypothetical protein Q9188_002378 [Gyalolechia gomerana]
MEAVLHGQRKGSQREQSLALRIPTFGPLRTEQTIQKAFRSIGVKGKAVNEKVYKDRKLQRQI